MAIAQKYLDVVGPDEENFSPDSAKDLSDLMVAMVYHRIDIASGILIEYNDESLLLLQGIAKELQELCNVCLFEKGKQWR